MAETLTPVPSAMQTDANGQPRLEGWAVVEMMGHQSLTGYVKSFYLGNVSMLEVLQPDTPWQEQVLAEHEYCIGSPEAPWAGRRLYPPGTRVMIGRAAGSAIVAATAVYRITLITEQQAKERLPLYRVVLSAPGEEIAGPAEQIAAQLHAATLPDADGEF